MSPPRPPSPPLGPPLGTNFSRRNARHPSPPSPAFKRIMTSSTNIGRKSRSRTTQRPPEPEPRAASKRPQVRAASDFKGHDADVLAHAAPVAPLDLAVDLGEQRVVIAYADILARLVTRAALAHDNRSARNHQAAEELDPQTLSVGIAPVFGTAKTFLMRHNSPLLLRPVSLRS